MNECCRKAVEEAVFPIRKAAETYREGLVKAMGYLKNPSQSEGKCCKKAVEDALPYSEHKRKWFNEGHEKGYQLGKSEAYEDAAKILEATKWKDAQDSISQAWNMKMDDLALLLRARAKVA